MNPTPSATTTEVAMLAGIRISIDVISKCLTSSPTVYAPVPKNKAFPKDNRPVYPRRTLSASAARPKSRAMPVR